MSFTDFWDKIVKPKAEEVFKTCKTDALVPRYVSQMAFYIEHDLADDRDPHLRLYPCVGCLNDEHYYERVHKDTDKAEVEKLREFGKLLKELEAKSFTLNFISNQSESKQA